QLAVRLHQEIASGVHEKLEQQLAKQPLSQDNVAEVLGGLTTGLQGRAFIVNHDGALAFGWGENDEVAQSALAALRKEPGGVGALNSALQFSFDHLSERPLSRETWLAYASAHR